MKELDMLTMPIAQKHPGTILETWRNLAEGDTLRIINDHDPKPLKYMFQVEFKDTFTWEYKQEGPVVWIVEINKVRPPGAIAPEQRQKREELKQLLKKLHAAAPEELERAKQEAAKYFKEVAPQELALAEQELIQEGTTRTEMRRLCDIHLEAMKDQLGVKGKKLKLPPAHPLSICQDEHKIIKRNLKKLGKLLAKLQAAGSFEKARKPLNALKELSHFFLETELHHRREEQAIFPRLKAHGIVEPPQIFEEDHVEFMARKKLLSELALAEEPACNAVALRAGKGAYPEFVNKITPLIEFLTTKLTDHIFKEDNILYPMAYATLSASEWPEVRQKFDAIGYCCFAPADLKKPEKKHAS